MRSSELALAILLLTSCATTVPAPGGEKVRIVQAADQVKGCRALGDVVARGPFAEPDEWKTKFQNEGVRLGADTVLLKDWSLGSQTFTGAAYQCGQEKTAEIAAPVPPPPPAPAARPEIPRPGAAPDVLFRVSRAGDKSPLEGIEASVLAGDGKSLAGGKTNGSGELRIAKSSLRAKGAVVLFCGRGVFCGAVRVRDENLAAIDELAIELAPRVP